MDMLSGNNSAVRTGFIYVATAALLFSIKAIFIKLAYRYDATPELLLTLRMLMSLPVYVFLLLRISAAQHQQVLQATNLIPIILLGLASYYAAALLDLSGLQYISANLERLIIYLYPTIVILLGAIFLGRRITLTMLACMAVAYVGIILVFTKDMTLTSSTTKVILGFQSTELALGVTLTLGSAICFACYVAFSENYIKRLGSVAFTCYAMIAASIAIIIHFLFREDIGLLFNQVWQIYTLTACIAVFSTLLPSFLMSEGIKHIGSANAGIIGTLGPVATLITAYFILDEPVTTIHIIGIVLVIGSVYALSKTAKNS
jgi:drug/metabolite transporter (DMT)-like permease